MEPFGTGAQVFKRHARVLTDSRDTSNREAPTPPQASCIDINTASVTELERIIHIGAVRAQEIIGLRRAQRFRSV